MITKITHLTLLVKNQEEAANFYAQNFGFKIHTDAMFGDLRWLTLNLSEQPDLELVIKLAQTTEEQNLIGKQFGQTFPLCFATSDCKTDYEKLTQLGVKFLEEPATHQWGIATTCKDLYGNLIYLCQSF